MMTYGDVRPFRAVPQPRHTRLYDMVRGRRLRVMLVIILHLSCNLLHVLHLSCLSCNGPACVLQVSCMCNVQSESNAVV